MEEISKIDVRQRQASLRQIYENIPEKALIKDRGRSTGGLDTDPFHGEVKPGSKDYGVIWSYGIHRAVGGDHDAPNPGDMLCSALAACMDSTIRMIADHLDVSITFLEVEVTAEVDVRGCLVVDRKVPVGFQKMECRVNCQTADGTDPKLENMLKTASEYSCVNMSTLRSGVPIETIFNNTTL
ncbi:MAG: OsmC family protein [Desulfosarcinaceae bacterium]|jgi:uncharacterized OsmC-like protein